MPNGCQNDAKGYQKATNISHNGPRAFQKNAPWKNIDGSVAKHRIVSRRWLVKGSTLGALLGPKMILNLCNNSMLKQF